VHLAELEREECIEPLMGSQGKQYTYSLTVDENGRPLDLNLSTPEEIIATAKRAGIEVTP
jgi:hypothetical protein